jgi:hypothetical protein
LRVQPAVKAMEASSRRAVAVEVLVRDMGDPQLRVARWTNGANLRVACACL